MLTVQKKIFSLTAMSQKSSNMTAKSGINTADTSKAYHFMVVGADALTMSKLRSMVLALRRSAAAPENFWS